MKNFRLSFLTYLILAGIFTGLWSSMLHPVFHVIKDDIHQHEHDFAHETNLIGEHASDISDHCLVCVFTKKLAVKDLIIDVSTFHDICELLIDYPSSIPHVVHPSFIFLRAPPLV